MKFKEHPSPELQKLFKKKPYQGQSPEKARIIILSSDANYSEEISKDNFFDSILEYHKDGIAFWKKNKCHHPFLLDKYPFNKNQGGVPYHRNFSKIGLDYTYADKICFLELLDIPTIGNKSKNKKLFYNLINPKHLEYLDNLILDSDHKLFLISGGVLRDMMVLKTKYDVFPWLDIERNRNKQYSKVLNGNKIQQIYHFSSSQIHSQVGEIISLINNWIKK